MNEYLETLHLALTQFCDLPGFYRKTGLLRNHPYQTKNEYFMVIFLYTFYVKYFTLIAQLVLENESQFALSFLSKYKNCIKGRHLNFLGFYGTKKLCLRFSEKNEIDSV